MRNINKDYLVVVNTKTATVRASSSMKFHVTDVLTCNIFFQLDFNDPNSRIVGLYAPEERASNYQLTLRVAKPSGEHKEIFPESFELLDAINNLYVVNLGTDFIDSIGFCECELLVKATVTTKDGSQHYEVFTTEMFKYEVVKSVFSDLNDEVYPDLQLIIDSLATKEYVKNEMEHMDNYGYATRKYVNEVLIGGGIDLSDYVTDKELKNALDNLPKYEEVDLSNYVTNQKLAEELTKVSSGGTIDLSEYATKQYVNDALDGIQDIDLSDYVTNEKLASELVKVSSGGTIDLSSYATKSELETYVTEQELEDALADSSGGNIDLSDYATKLELNNKSNVDHIHEEYITDADLVAKDYATKSQIPTELPASGGNANTVRGYGICVCSQEEYDVLENENRIDKDILYFIREDV